MSLTERHTELLILLAEECGEVVQRCTKMLRFGPIGGPGRPHTTTNTEEMELELGDLLAVAISMDREGLVSWDRIVWNAVAKRQKLYDGVLTGTGQKE